MENDEAKRILLAGGVVALPTDTVFGLCARASDAAAVERIYVIKQRNPAQAMPIFVASTGQAEEIGEFNEVARRLGIATGSIGFIRKRCLDKLRRAVEKRGLEPSSPPRSEPSERKGGAVRNVEKPRP